MAFALGRRPNFARPRVSQQDSLALVKSQCMWDKLATKIGLHDMSPPGSSRNRWNLSRAPVTGDRTGRRFGRLDRSLPSGACGALMPLGLDQSASWAEASSWVVADLVNLSNSTGHGSQSRYRSSSMSTIRALMSCRVNLASAESMTASRTADLGKVSSSQSLSHVLQSSRSMVLWPSGMAKPSEHRVAEAPGCSDPTYMCLTSRLARSTGSASARTKSSLICTLESTPKPPAFDGAAHSNW
eukprot:CAMPEP_0170246388 /NCGR_PEP_ID=MMETSP0116_2-20130129/22981_1 /TAXON_ID=400756 /ORGANISM="Durinskia baltica, Strain CSIRO CS-38" /LENGTH=241 /DNA_ID=CAMNT_0010497265 /DNA_START=11 /DNA_END=737 /DNA_ORIENTATION=-